MFARILLGGALGMALVTFSPGANAESDGNGRVDRFNADRHPTGDRLWLTQDLDDRDRDRDRDRDHRHRHRSRHHDD